MASVRRFDRGEIRKADKTPEGFLRAPAFISRTGIYLYVDADGKITRELRRPEQVFDPESLRSFALAPVTDGHPAEGYVDASTARKYARGSLGEIVEPDGNMVRSTLAITDADLVRKVLDGESAECSCGYTCEVLPGGGEWEGQRYDTEQTKIRGNHVAIVPAGRAGPAARVKLDAGDAIAVSDTSQEITTMEREITIHGIKFKLAATVCDAIEAQIASASTAAQARVDAAGKCPKCDAKLVDGECPKCGKVKADALAASQARADALAAEVATLNAAAVTATAGESKRVSDALEVVDVARRAGVAVKIDSLDLGALRRAVAEKVNGVKLEGKADAYVLAAFDIARAKVDASATGAALLGTLETPETKTDEADPRAAMVKRNADAWKATPTK